MRNPLERRLAEAFREERFCEASLNHSPVRRRGRISEAPAMLIWGGARRPVFGVVFSPDGTHLGFGTKDHLVQVWDAATGAERGCDVCLCAGGHSLLFSPDGGCLVAAGDRTQVW